MAVIMHYSADVYRTKINTFTSLNSELDGKLQELENLRDRIRDFYDSVDAGKFIQAITKAIVRVQQASDNVKSLNRQYEETVAEMDRIGGAVDTIQENIDKTVDRTIEVAKVAVDVIPLL